MKQLVLNIKLLRIIMIAGLACWLLALNILSATFDYTYEIRFASHSINHWEIKNQILSVYDNLTQRVSDEYKYEIISQGIEEFAITDDSKALLKHSRIVITIGDGEGLVVAGKFEPSCKVEVKKKSLLLTLLGK